MTGPRRDDPGPAARDTAGRLATWRFVVPVASTFGVFTVFGMALPVVPRLVEHELQAGPITVGAVFGVYALAGIVVRPLVGYLGDRYGRRRLVAVGALVSVVALLLHVGLDSLPELFVLRALAGAGQAATFVGLASTAVDVAPTGRRGEASSYLFVALQVGLGTGPLAGEALWATIGPDAVWVASSAVIGAVVLLPGLATLRQDAPDAQVAFRLREVVHVAGARPGTVMALGSLGFIGFLAFAPLLAEDIGLVQVAPLYLLASLTKGLVRAVAARVPDRIGSRRTALAALALMVVGLTVMGTWTVPQGLTLGVVILAAGSAMLSPALLLAVVTRAGARDRNRAIATFTMFFDAASGFGPLLLGAVASRAGYHVALLVAAATAVAATMVTRGLRMPAPTPPTPSP